jgi:sugar transferase EpsL
VEKRLFDILIGVIVLIFFILPLIIISVLVFMKLGRPVFFSQLRPGLHGKIFKMYKFRTMSNECDNNGHLLAKERRLSGFGRKLRSTSLDELPEIFNVLKGEMSLVGPRPLRIEYLPYYSEEQARRHEVKPGITGWAQINGRNVISWEEKFKLDVWYVENRSFILDIKILLLTFRKVIGRDGINQSDETTMEPFKGINLNG